MFVKGDSVRSVPSQPCSGIRYVPVVVVELSLFLRRYYSVGTVLSLMFGEFTSIAGEFAFEVISLLSGSVIRIVQVRIVKA